MSVCILCNRRVAYFIGSKEYRLEGQVNDIDLCQIMYFSGFAFSGIHCVTPTTPPEAPKNWPVPEDKFPGVPWTPTKPHLSWTVDFPSFPDFFQGMGHTLEDPWRLADPEVSGRLAISPEVTWKWTEPPPRSPGGWTPGIIWRLATLCIYLSGDRRLNSHLDTEPPFHHL